MLSLAVPIGAPLRGRLFRTAFPAMAPRFVAIGALVLIAILVALAPGARPLRHAVPAPRVAPTDTVAAVPPAVEAQRLVPVTPETARLVNADRPFDTGPLVAARPYRWTTTPMAKARAIDCLAVAGWYEAGDDSRGQRGVMQVVLNRARHRVFPATICGVVFQGAERATGCQFTFTCDGAMLKRRPTVAALTRARGAAAAALDGAVDRDVGLATHYHADYVVPYWAASMEKSAQVGPHLFYRWKGYWGTKAAFGREESGEEPVIAAMAPLSPAHAATPMLLAAVVPASTDVTAASLPTAAIAVAGVREKSLRGAVVRGRTALTDHYFLQLDAATFPGNYATAAVALCKDKPVCTVLGWRDAARMGQALPLNAQERDALSFYYVQGSDGNGKALWNCQQMPRSNKAQCLDTADIG